MQIDKINMELNVNSDLQQFESKIKQTINSLFEDVDKFISDLKVESSEEILNGSVAKAQELLSQVMPYQNFYEKLKEAKYSFDNINSLTNQKESKQVDKKEDAKEEGVEFVEVEDVEEVLTDDQLQDFTSQEKFRIPILKALIFLGGSADENEVTEFVKKDMKNKLTALDYEIPEGEDKERWLSSLYFETATMIDEGLLSNESGSKKWEIAQKGIDYLGKYGK